MQIFVDDIPVCSLSGLMPNGQFFDEDERVMRCRESMERGVICLRETFPDIVPQACVVKVLRAVCTAANSGLCDPNLESNVLMAYMKHHNVLDRFTVTSDDDSWYPAR